MKNFKLFTALISFLLLISGTMAQTGNPVKSIKSVPNKTVTVKGNLSSGDKLNDLSWASRSSVACFPATQNKKFNGNHVLYTTQLPGYSVMNITVTPDNKNDNFSIYAYTIGTSSNAIVPDLTSCVSCEAEHKWDYPKRGKTQDHTRSVSLNAIRNPYKVVIGVVGANGLTTGGFTLSIDLKTKNSNAGKVQKTPKVYAAKAEPNKTLSYKGNLKEGVKIHDLSWASRSSVACFPATQNKKFNGKHLFYKTSLPKRSVLTITVIPKNKKHNLSLYAYTTGQNSARLVTNLTSCISCEADHKWDYPKRGKTQDHTRSVKLNAVNNPYDVIIGVAGANGLNESEFVISLKLEQ